MSEVWNVAVSVDPRGLNEVEVLLAESVECAENRLRIVLLLYNISFIHTNHIHSYISDEQ